jgi:hypothetical protein
LHASLLWEPQKELLFTSLKKLGLDEDHPDPVLGDWKKLIDYFVKEMYTLRSLHPLLFSRAALADTYTCVFPTLRPLFDRYIHRQKITGRVSASGAVISEYRWGGRALLEVDKIEIMR